MKNWQQALIAPQVSLRDALKTIDEIGTRMVLVVDQDNRLMGTLSDGDARRGLLRGLTLEDRASLAMNASPTTVTAGSEQSIIPTMRRLGLHQIPVLSADGVVRGLYTLDEMFTTPVRENRVVIMAGGRGTRLAELTQSTPKPMLKVGTRPLLETIVSSFSAQGFKNIVLSVNYMADQIQSHFGDGSAFGVNISYLQEDQPLGTAGALKLLDKQTLPIIVTNADLLTKENFGDMLDRHVEMQADATMAVRNYEMQVPFGVVQEIDGEIKAIDEKPIQTFVVSAGIYVLSPQVLSLIPGHQAFDMPMLFDAMFRQGLKGRCHHIDGYWLDIGRIADYERANLDFPQFFR